MVQQGTRTSASIAVPCLRQASDRFPGERHNVDAAAIVTRMGETREEKVQACGAGASPLHAAQDKTFETRRKER
jgi:hypothetical protein